MAVEDAHLVFERGTPAGDALYRLYGGKKAMPSTVNPAMLRRAQQNRLQREREAAVPKPKQQPRSRAHIPVPRQVGRPSGASDAQPAGYSFLPPRPGRRAVTSEHKLALEAEIAAQPAPTRRFISDADKDRLVEHMQYNGEKPPSPPALPALPPPPSPPKSDLQSLKELFDEVQREIEDRKEFLSEMRSLGKAKPHEAQIKSEMAERVRQLRRIDALIKDEENSIRGMR
eukprot:TRINITY_DN19735_c0_g2_i1.p1 TRINITY_DN19735_c0_g2~~TRINITY_DN19735_c0_g2_i1.p1  ORF type:complete len:243 (+),score=82.26 TRINITY_DN19735_c0_g2_i1:44-730(+)